MDRDSARPAMRTIPRYPAGGRKPSAGGVFSNPRLVEVGNARKIPLGGRVESAHLLSRRSVHGICSDACGVQPFSRPYRVLGVTVHRITASKVVVDFPIYGMKSRSIKNTFLRAATGGLLERDAADR